MVVSDISFFELRDHSRFSGKPILRLSQFYGWKSEATEAIGKLFYESHRDSWYREHIWNVLFSDLACGSSKWEFDPFVDTGVYVTHVASASDDGELPQNLRNFVKNSAQFKLEAVRNTFYRRWKVLMKMLLMDWNSDLFRLTLIWSNESFKQNHLHRK